ncbi:methyltransferase domain-containing protein [Aliikangiella sp. IMCC44653]
MSQANPLAPFDDEDQMTNKRLELIEAALAQELCQIFGFNALLYKPMARKLCQQHLSIRQQVVISQDPEQSDVQCRFEELPIASDCIDLAVLPSILQCSQYPHQVLREVERVLIPEGVVIIIGRNPLSWLGISTRIKQFKQEQWRTSFWREVLWRQADGSNRSKQNKTAYARDISKSRVCDWFNLLGFEVEKEVSISVSNARIEGNSVSRWVKKITQIFCDCFCSYYIIVGRKKVSTLTPIRPSWRRNKQLVSPRLAEPSIRSLVQQWFEKFHR